MAGNIIEKAKIRLMVVRDEFKRRADKKREQRLSSKNWEETVRVRDNGLLEICLMEEGRRCEL